MALILALVLMLLAPGAARAAASLTAESEQFMVVSAQYLAAEAGAEMLRKGGNAIDAAVAMGYAEAVTNPCCGNIGGGGFLVAHLADGRDIFINFRETAPAAARPDMFLDAGGTAIPGASLHGWKAAGVPGTVLGLDTALTRYGSLPRAVVMAPAIRLAREGFPLTSGDAAILAHFAGVLHQSTAAARIFLRPDGTAMQTGDRLVQTDLARTLDEIAAAGPDAFYRGRAAALVARDSGGALTEADFAAYQVTETPPIRCSYRGYVVLAPPPPSSGGTALCEVLGVLGGYDLRAAGFQSARSVHLIVEAARHAFLDRNTFLGDPAFVRNPVDWLLSPAHLDAIRARIGDRATPSQQVTAGTGAHERPETTHYSVADRAGNAVSVTYTINGAFGSGVMADGTGFLLNNEMDDFTIKPGTANNVGLVQGATNQIAPGKRPLSSMTPTVVLRDGHTALVLGSPGGPRIITAVLQAILNVVDHGMTAREAVDAPRLHHQWLPDTVYLEQRALSADTRTVLEGMGYALTEQGRWGAVALITAGPAREPASPAGAEVQDAAIGERTRPGVFHGAIDSRRPAGAAIGE